MFQKLSDKSNSTADHSGGCSGRQKQRYRLGRSIRPELDLPAPAGRRMRSPWSAGTAGPRGIPGRAGTASTGPAVIAEHPGS